MATFTIQMEGQADFAAKVRVWERERRARIGALIRSTAEDIATDAAASAPERSGRLKKAIKALVERALSDLVADVEAGVFYARFVEVGTTKLAAKPFLFPAWERHSQRYFDGLRRILST